MGFQSFLSGRGDIKGLMVGGGVKKGGWGSYIPVLFDLGVFVGCCDSAVVFEFAGFHDAYGSVDVEVS
jgi:hypothetical protein